MKKLRGMRRHEAIEDGRFKLCGVAAAMVVGAGITAYSSSSSASDIADSSAQSSAASIASNERIAARQEALANRQFDAAEARNARMDALTQRVTESQLATQDKQNALADDYDAYNKGTYRPLEQRIVNEAETYDTVDKQNAAADQAATDFGVAASASKAATARNMARMGVNPADGRSLSMQDNAAAEALGSVTASNTARDKIKALGAAKRMDAASLGRNLPSSQATSAGLGINAGNSAVTNLGTANSAAVLGTQPGISLLGGAATTNNGIGNNALQLYSAANKSSSDNMNGYGQMAGMALKYYGAGA